ncbi:MAG: acetyl/propionyl/methylcrotonyl-CoA carboxylase subunit alpha [Pseudomonadota bacterium]
MFSKILVANRGEIACRVFSTAKRLGVKSVAIYSDADHRAKHVTMADEAFRIGPAPVSESYLQGDEIIEVAKTARAEAIHPGYGFLSENPDFVEAVEAAGLVFIGPPAEAIRAMGLKDTAKRRMAQVGVPVVPGYHGESQDPLLLASEAEKIGYPVLIKARAGGGGKGMRLVETPGGFATALEGARREAEASFGDPSCLIEKFVASPRHIEIQVFGDAHGNVIHLFERDCSLQRRHQKVIEEAPAPGMPEAVRKAMGRAAVEAAKAIGYQGAGTVEFIADGSAPLSEDGFWFMEMNTRLQVEHPVSEAITGLDFVELQLRVAAGEPLPLGQKEVTIDGSAIEARLYAEDVAKGFLPSTGSLRRLVFPPAAEFEVAPLRIDAGVREGDEISPWYDPMIAKIITHGPTRDIALSRLSAALSSCRVSGTVTNLAFLDELSRHPGVRAGGVDTGVIGRDFEKLSAVASPSEEVKALAAILGLGLADAPDSNDPWERLRSWRHWTWAEDVISLECGDEQFSYRVFSDGSGRCDVDTETGLIRFDVVAEAPGLCRATKDGRCVRVEFHREETSLALYLNDVLYEFTRPTHAPGGETDGAGGDRLHAPMPGLVKAVSTVPGDVVSAGSALLILEAMKMEHTLSAPRDGVVAEVLAANGDQVSEGTLLVVLEPEGD